MRPAFAALLAGAMSVLPAGAQTVDSLALRADARALADDSLLGRATGSAGERIAATYIARRLEAAGVTAPGGFRIPVPLLRAGLSADSRIRIGADTTPWMAGRDFVMGRTGRGGLHAFEGPGLFVGRTTEAPPAAALAGHVVVTVGPLGEPAADVLREWARAGVAGVIVPVAAEALAATELLLVDAPLDDPIWQPALPVVYAGPALTAALFAGVVDETLPIALPSVHAGLTFDTKPAVSTNLFAIVPGTDPALADEIVLLTAHYDHLGIGPAVAGDSIYNGFSDNAAGVAMLLEIARRVAAEPLPRPVAFLFASGEERGLLGSTYFASYPPVPLHRLHAVLNLDAGAPPAPPVRWRVAGDTADAVLATAAAVVRARGWTADVTGSNANSDHWPFRARGIPTVFLVPGRDWEGLDDAARDSLFQRWDRYHQPGDEWRDGFPLAGMARYTGLALAITRALAGGS